MAEGNGMKSVDATAKQQTPRDVAREKVLRALGAAGKVLLEAIDQDVNPLRDEVKDFRTRVEGQEALGGRLEREFAEVKAKATALQDSNGELIKEVVGFRTDITERDGQIDGFHTHVGSIQEMFQKATVEYADLKTAVESAQATRTGEADGLNQKLKEVNEKLTALEGQLAKALTKEAADAAYISKTAHQESEDKLNGRISGLGEKQKVVSQGNAVMDAGQVEGLMAEVQAVRQEIAAARQELSAARKAQPAPQIDTTALKSGIISEVNEAITAHVNQVSEELTGQVKAELGAAKAELAKAVPKEQPPAPQIDTAKIVKDATEAALKIVARIMGESRNFHEVITGIERELGIGSAQAPEPVPAAQVAPAPVKAPAPAAQIDTAGPAVLLDFAEADSMVENLKDFAQHARNPNQLVIAMHEEYDETKSVTSIELLKAVDDLAAFATNVPDLVLLVTNQVNDLKGDSK